MPLDCVIIGCGRIFSKHAVALNSLDDKVRVVGVIDTDDVRASNGASYFSCPSYKSIEQFCDVRTADFAVILTPSGMHADNIKSISKNVDTILVEKPACLALDDLEDLYSLHSKGKKIFVVKQNRYNRPIVQLKQWCDTGKSNDLVYGTIRLRWCRDKNYYQQDAWRGTWAYDGGVLTNQASHHIDILQMFMGEIEEVYATSIHGEPSIEVENTALVNIRFKTGALGMIEASNAIRPKNLEASLSLIFRDGIAEIGGHALNKWLNKPTNMKSLAPEFFKHFDNPEFDTSDVYGSGHISLYRDLMNYLKVIIIICRYKEGGKSVILLHAIYESIETGLPVSISASFKNSKLGK